MHRRSNISGPSSTEISGFQTDVSTVTPHPRSQAYKRPASALEEASSEAAEYPSLDVPTALKALRKKRTVVKKDGQIKAHPPGGDWEDAAYHHKIREQLLIEADQLGLYDIEPAAGTADDDQTAYLASQRTWAGDGTNPSSILYQFDQIGTQHPDYDPVQWYWRGSLVLDTEDRAMIAWRDLPATVSSEVEVGDTSLGSVWTFASMAAIQWRKCPRRIVRESAACHIVQKSFAILIGFIPGLQGIEVESIGTYFGGCC